MLNEEQQKELSKAKKKSAAYRQWYEANKERVAAQRKARYENDPEYRERILENRKKQREREKEARQRRAIQGNVLENRKLKTFKVNSDLGSCVSTFYSIGQLAKEIGVAVATLRKWERDGVLPLPIYRTDGQHRLYTEDQVSIIKEVFLENKQGKWSLKIFKSELNLKLSTLNQGIRPEKYKK
jgi:hypothetical protein